VEDSDAFFRCNKICSISIMSRFQMTIFHQGEQRSSQFDRFDLLGATFIHIDNVVFKHTKG
jgi:hypothetical protein